MQTTKYFMHMRHRTGRQAIMEAWIEEVIGQPEHEEIQADGRIRLWGTIAEAGGKALRVILLPDRKTVHNAFFDRRFNKSKP